jgi:hypothetical protein
MRRLATVGVLLVAISSFLAFQATCRPFFICLERTCEIDGKQSTSLGACAAQAPRGNGRCGRCAETEPGERGCEARAPETRSGIPCMPDFDFSSTKTCCDSKDIPEPTGACPKRVLSCVYCIPARFVWEPAPVVTNRSWMKADAPARTATIAMGHADRERRLLHTHSPPALPPALAGSERRVELCSFLL